MGKNETAKVWISTKAVHEVEKWFKLILIDVLPILMGILLRSNTLTNNVKLIKDQFKFHEVFFTYKIRWAANHASTPNWIYALVENKWGFHYNIISIRAFKFFHKIQLTLT